jgi:predicted Fe-Mo cluster-binding NifX family protein
MKVAIPASGNKMDAYIDERFGRCPFFCFYDTKTNKFDFKEDNLKDDSGGVGPQVATFMADNEVNEVYAVEVGFKAQNMLDKLNISVKLISSGQTINQVVNMFNN